MVRRAVAHLIDKKTLIRQIFQNFAIPAATPLPPQVFGFNPRISHHPFDLERARSLLKQAGIRGGFSCKFLFLKDDEGERRIADAFVRNAALIGIEIEKDAKPFPEIMRTLRAGSHDILLRGWNAGPDPDLFLFTNFTMDPGNSNRAYYSNTELTRLLRSARETLDPKKRRDMYHRIQEIIFTDVPWIPLYHRHDLIVHNIRLKHLFLNANSFLIFRDTLWERQEE
jgi:peptide/nickel transport system substrate-binding protein